MKISQQNISIIGVLIILGLSLVRSPLKHWERHDIYDVVYTQQPTQFDKINTEIKNTKYKLDSLNFKKAEDINEGNSFNGWTYGYLGIGEFRKKGMYFADSLAYLGLSSIGVNINEEIGNSYLAYFEKNGQGYLSRTKLIGNFEETTEVYDNGKQVSRKGNKVVFINKKVDYKYSYRDKSMIVPIKSKFIEIVITIVIYAIELFHLVLILFIVFTFFRFLMYIARNNAFSIENIQRLSDMAIAFLILSIKTFAVNAIIYLVFIANYSSDGVVINYSFWENDYSLLISAILCYMIYTAFKRGMALQQEHELTI